MDYQKWASKKLYSKTKPTIIKQNIMTKYTIQRKRLNDNWIIIQPEIN